MILIFTALLVSSSFSIAQPEVLWSHTYTGVGDHVLYSVIQTEDGGFTMAGSNGYWGHVKFWLLRTDQNGDTLWTKEYGGNETVYCNNFIQTSDGGYLLAGTTSLNSTDFFVIRTDEHGDSLWSRTYGGRDQDRCNDLIQTSDGGFALAGETGSFGAGWKDFWLLRIDADGDSLWSQTYGGGHHDRCNSIVQTEDDGFAMAGLCQSFGGQKFWLVRADENGDSLWSYLCGGEYLNVCNDLVLTDDGHFIMVGPQRVVGEGNYDDEFGIVEVDENGRHVWSNTYGGRRREICYSVVQPVFGGFILTGFTNSFGAGGSDFWLLGLDEDGDSLWSWVMGGEGSDNCRSIVRTTDGGYAILGKLGGEECLVKTEADPEGIPIYEYPRTADEFGLFPGYPNPFNSTTTIKYTVTLIRVHPVKKYFCVEQ